MADQTINTASPQLKVVKPTTSFASIRTITALILREISTTYGRSPGGYIWAILEPALGIALMVGIFSSGFKSPRLGTNFAIYFATGFLPFFMFLTTSSKIAQSVNYSRQLLAYPRVTIVDAIAARFLLNVLTQAIVSYILLTGILLIYETRTQLVFGTVLKAYTMAACLGLGVGLFNCMLSMRFRLWQTIWNVMTRPLVFISGVMFLHDNIPEPWRTYLEWNPLVHVVGENRKAFYFSYRAEYVDETYVFVVAIITGAIGFFFLRRYYRDMMER